MERKGEIRTMHRVKISKTRYYGRDDVFEKFSLKNVSGRYQIDYEFRRIRTYNEKLLSEIIPNTL